MPTFFFSFEATPTSASPRATDIAGGIVHVFVHCARAEDAEVIARSHVMDYGWRITAVQHALGPMPEQIPGLDAGLVALRKKAELHGVASEFVAWPKQERPTSSGAEIRPLGKPTTDPGQH